MVYSSLVILISYKARSRLNGQDMTLNIKKESLRGNAEEERSTDWYFYRAFQTSGFSDLFPISPHIHPFIHPLIHSIIHSSIQRRWCKGTKQPGDREQSGSVCCSETRQHVQQKGNQQPGRCQTIAQSHRRPAGAEQLKVKIRIQVFE